MQYRGDIVVVDIKQH